MTELHEQLSAAGDQSAALTLALRSARDGALALEAERDELRRHVRLPEIGIGFGTGQVTVDNVSQWADKIAAMGLTRVRITLPWASCQPKAGAPVKVPDRFVSICQTFAMRGLHVLVILAYTPGWQQSQASQFAMPKDPAAFAMFCVAARQQLPMVDEWEVWNEPNHGGIPTPTPGLVSPNRAKDYGRLVRATHDVAAFPRPHTVLAGVVCPAPNKPPTAQQPAPFVEAWYDEHPDAGEQYDQLSVHPYSGSLPFDNDTENGWVTHIIPAIQQRLIAAGDDRGRLFCASECGYTTKGKTALSETAQADMLVGMVTTWRTLPYAGSMYLFSFQDLGAGDTYSEGLGLHKIDGTPKRCVAALREVLT